MRYDLTSLELFVAVAEEANLTRAAERQHLASDDRTTARASMERIWSLWREVPGTLLIPGHDLSMRLADDGTPVYIGERRAGIAAWFAESIELVSEVDLCGGHDASVMRDAVPALRSVTRARS